MTELDKQWLHFFYNHPLVGHIMSQSFSHIHGSPANQSAGTQLFAVLPLSPIDKMINFSPSAINGPSGNEPGGLPRDLWAEIDGV
ncbi:hypothetical protein CDAR_112551 [Caerostris darwini]|uniref:Uncharacterized protein n=1 Tax=Caerostris darwini TaxID=1538125 RepID=A0AAV4Q1C7_9ARAC|nr:hypothetical protein CDAR_112551 [Caerostris darwini]